MDELKPLEPLFSTDELRRTTALQMAMDIRQGSSDLAAIMKSAKEIEAYLKGAEPLTNT